MGLGGGTDQPALPPRARRGQGRAPDGKDLSFSLSVSPLAMALKQPPSLSAPQLTHWSSEI